MRTPDFTHEHQVPRRPHHVAPHLSSVRLVLVVHRWKAPAKGTCDHGLSVTIDSTMRVLRRAGVHCESWAVRGAEELKNRIAHDQWAGTTARPITHMVINTPSFIWPETFSDLSLQWPDIEFIQLSHSDMAYLSIDKYGHKHIGECLDLSRARHNVKVAGNNRRFTDWVRDGMGHNALYLPNLYDTTSFSPGPVVSRRDPDPLRIGSFGAGRPWKNQLVATQAATIMARRLGVRLELYVNSQRVDSDSRLVESRAELMSLLPPHSLHIVPWASWTSFRKRVADMDLLISASFADSFCVICADGIAENVPSVVGPAMDWCPKSWYCEPHDPSSVARVGLSLLHDRVGAVHDGRVALTDYVEHGIPQWINYLTS